MTSMHHTFKTGPLFGLLCALACSAAAPGEQKPDLLARVQALEEKDQLIEALRLLQTDDAGQQYKEHRQSLESVISAFRFAGVYVARNQAERARTLLDGLLQKLDPIRDASLLPVVQRKLN